MKKYKTAIIGFGNIGFYYSLDKKRTNTWSHFEAYNKIKNTKTVAIVETNNKKRLKIKGKFPKINLYKNLDDLLSSEHNIDIISICSPTSTHFEILKKLIKKNIKIIICEKPICSSITQAKEIYNLSKKRKSIIVVNHQRRFEQNFLSAKKIIKKNLIGKVKFINACYTRKIYNIGTHLIDIIRMLVSSEISHTSSFLIEKKLEKDPSLSGLVFFKNNVCCSIQSLGYKFKYIFEIEVFGTKGKIKISDNGKKIELFKFLKSKNFTNYFELKKVKIRDRLKIKKSNDPMKELIEKSILAYSKKLKLILMFLMDTKTY